MGESKSWTESVTACPVGEITGDKKFPGPIRFVPDRHRASMVASGVSYGIPAARIERVVGLVVRQADREPGCAPSLPSHKGKVADVCYGKLGPRPGQNAGEMR